VVLRQDLAEVLADQLAAIGCRRPARARVIASGDAVIFVFPWFDPVERLEMTGPLLADLVERDRRRRVRDLSTTAGESGGQAMISFVLGEPIEDSERLPGLRNWTAQVKRNSREVWRDSLRGRLEARRVRAGVRRCRAERRLAAARRGGWSVPAPRAPEARPPASWACPEEAVGPRRAVPPT
jgi:hypothetical protein